MCNIICHPLTDSQLPFFPRSPDIEQDAIEREEVDKDRRAVAPEPAKQREVNTHQLVYFITIY